MKRVLLMVLIFLFFGFGATEMAFGIQNTTTFNPLLMPDSSVNQAACTNQANPIAFNTSAYAASTPHIVMPDSPVNQVACTNQANPIAFNTSAYAASTPHIVISENVWLLNTDGEKLFLLPKTYYAAITSLDETYYLVSFNGVSGKVLKTSVRSTGYHTQASGTAESLKIDDRYAEFSRLAVKKKPDRSAETVTEMPTKESFTFVGIFPKETEVWYAIRYNEHFGYVRAELTNKKEMTFPDFVPEQEPQDQPTTADPIPGAPDSDPKDSEAFSPFKIIMIVGLALPAVFIILLLFKKDGKNGKKPKSFD